MATRKAMKLIDGRSGEMQCRVCGSVHYASMKPFSGGHYVRGSWQCSYQNCPTNQKVWSETARRFVKANTVKEAVCV